MDYFGLAGRIPPNTGYQLISGRQNTVLWSVAPQPTKSLNHLQSLWINCKVTKNVFLKCFHPKVTIRAAVLFSCEATVPKFNTALRLSAPVKRRFSIALEC